MTLERYYDAGPGYHPYLIREQRQVAQLNYAPEQDAQMIDFLEMHPQTDETFTLLAGEAFLVIGDETGDLQPAAGDCPAGSGETAYYPGQIEMVWLEAGVTYNVPKGVWHNIAMREGSTVLIVENANTHLMEKGLLTLPASLRERMVSFEQAGRSI